MDLITSKETILNEINKLINSYQERENENSEKFKTLTNDVSVTHEMNLKLIKEIEEKDKLIMLSEKKCYDYEIMINKIQDEANKEIDEKIKQNMIRAKDKEIFNCENEIKRLQKQVDDLTKRNNELENSDSNDHDNEEEIRAYYENLWKNENKNSLVNEPEKVRVAIEGYSEHTGLSDITEKEVGMSSLGINGWYNDTINLRNNKKKASKTLVEKMKEESKKQKQTVVDEINNPIVSEVVEDVEVDQGETTEELSDVELKDEVEEVKVETINDVKDKEEEESTDEEEVVVSTIKHYGKEYYIVDGEDPQYMYAIEDGDLGDKKGVVVNGKKQLYKK